MVWKKVKNKRVKPGERVIQMTKVLSSEGLLLTKKDIEKINNAYLKDYKIKVSSKGAMRLRLTIKNKVKKDEELVLRILEKKGLKVNAKNIQSVKVEDLLAECSGYNKGQYPLGWVNLLQKTMIMKLKNGEYKHV